MNPRVVATWLASVLLLPCCTGPSDEAPGTAVGNVGSGGATLSPASGSTATGTTGDFGQGGGVADAAGGGGGTAITVASSVTVGTTGLGAGGSGGTTTFGAAGGATATGAGNAGGTAGAGGTPGSGGSAGGAAQASGGTGVMDPGSDGDGRFEIGPPYDAVNLDPVNPQGTVYDFVMESSDSTIYPGLNGPYSRQVEVYVPAQYEDGVAAPFMVVQDGPGHTGRLRRALDNLIADGGAPALIAILVNHGGGDGVGSERGLEYDTLSDVYVQFVETEVLPAVLSDGSIAADYPNLALTDDPEGRAAMGCSSGAAAAFTMAWFGSDRYRRVLSYSGTFVDQQDPQVETYPNGAWEYHEHLIDDAGLKPLRVYLEVGQNDLGADTSEAGLHNWVLANERMFDALTRNGYHTRFEFALGVGHCDGSVMDHTIYEALEWLWRGYPI